MTAQPSCGEDRNATVLGDRRRTSRRGLGFPERFGVAEMAASSAMGMPQAASIRASAGGGGGVTAFPTGTGVNIGGTAGRAACPRVGCALDIAAPVAIERGVSEAEATG